MTHADIVITVGEQNFSDGESLTQGTYNSAQSDDPSNGLDASYFEFRGADLDNSSPGNWSDQIAFSGYGSVNGIASASLKLGLWDHDSAAAGDQVKEFSLGSLDLTAELNALLNSSGGEQGFFISEYNVYELNLDAAAFADLSDGNAVFQLEFQNGRGASDTIYNGVGLDFAELRITSSAVPELEDSVWVLAILGGIFVWHERRRRLKSQVTPATGNSHPGK